MKSEKIERGSNPPPPTMHSFYCLHCNCGFQSQHKEIGCPLCKNKLIDLGETCESTGLPISECDLCILARKYNIYGR